MKALSPIEWTQTQGVTKKMEYFPFVKQVQYKGPSSTEPFAFKYYDANRIVCGKPMKEWMPFAMAWWHNLGAAGQS